MRTNGAGPAHLSTRFTYVVDIGYDHFYTWLFRRPQDWPDDEAWLVDSDALFPEDTQALIIQHPHREHDDRWCENVVHIRMPHNRLTDEVWKVIDWAPLTLERSILCGACGDQGEIKQGKWVEV